MVTFHFKNSADTLVLMQWLTWPIILPTFLQVVLDITFYEENKLVDQEFPEDTSPFKIQQLLQDLTEPEVLAGRLVPAQEVLYFSAKDLFSEQLLLLFADDFLSNTFFRVLTSQVGVQNKYS